MPACVRLGSDTDCLVACDATAWRQHDLLWRPRNVGATAPHDYEYAAATAQHDYEYGDVGEDATANTETFAGFGVPANDLAF